jgi:Rrf2 family transcriptional regulator, iron-sulfur cluster assembly transcription factor
LTKKYGYEKIAVVQVPAMKITAQEEYGLRCILQLASMSAGEPLAGTEIARREGLSYPYVEKLLWTLKKAGLTESHRGVKGGYVLSRPADQISLGDVQRAFGSIWATKDICSRHTGNRRICIHHGACTLRPVWEGIEQYIVGVMDGIPISHLLGKEALVQLSLGDTARMSA